MSSNERYTFVIPTYNGSERLRALVANLCTNAPLLPGNMEIVIVDDGSVAEEWHKVREIALNTPACRALKLSHNLGQHRATLIGIVMAQPGAVITLDDDSSPEIVLAVTTNIEVLKEPLAVDTVHYLRTHHVRTPSLGAVLRATVKTLLALLSSFPLYLRASSTRILGNSVAKRLVTTFTDPAGDLVIPACKISLDAVLLSSCSNLSFSAASITTARIETRYTWRTLANHAATVLMSMWYYRGIRAFLLPVVLSCLFVPLSLLPVTATILLILPAVGMAYFMFHGNGRYLRILDVLERDVSGSRGQ
jgi:glycosyltransferase involved in cell wall biosynthesis